MPTSRLRALAALLALVFNLHAACGDDSAGGDPADSGSTDDGQSADTGEQTDTADAGQGDDGDSSSDGGPDGVEETGDADVTSDTEDTGPASVGPIVLELGEVASGTTLEFEVPEDTLGFHIVARADGTDYVGIRSLEAPSGETVLDDFSHEGAPFSLAADVTGVASTQVPQNRLDSTMPPEPGTWSMVVECLPIAVLIDVNVYIQTSRGDAFEGGVLDVVIYIPEGLVLSEPDPARTIDAVSAAEDANVAARLDSFFDALQSLTGIDRGEVTFVDVDSRFLQIESESVLGEAAHLATGAPETPAMHFVWTSLLSPYGTELWGTSPGAPGVVVQTGTVRSAVVLDVTAGFPAVADGWTMLHEMGHFVGLLHTSFPEGVGDLLDDTETCPDLDAGIEDRNCPDRTNLMFPVFWGATGGVGIELSEDQVRVFQGSPVYRAYQ